MKQKNLIVFASGKKDSGGGTGAKNLAERLPERVGAFVSSHPRGGVYEKAEALDVPFFYFPGPYTTEGYGDMIRKISEELKINEKDFWYALSGWFKKVCRLSSARTFNIHPAPLPRFAGMYGEKLHRSVWDAYQNGEIAEGEIVMQFVNHASPKYDDGSIFFRCVFSLATIGNYEGYREYVRVLEHRFQPEITRMVIDGEISWDGIHPESLKVPAEYSYL